MTKAERLAAIFGIAFAVIYAPMLAASWHGDNVDCGS